MKFADCGAYLVRRAVTRFSFFRYTQKIFTFALTRTRYGLMSPGSLHAAGPFDFYAADRTTIHYSRCCLSPHRPDPYWLLSFS